MRKGKGQKSKTKTYSRSGVVQDLSCALLFLRNKNDLPVKTQEHKSGLLYSSLNVLYLRSILKQQNKIEIIQSILMIDLGILIKANGICGTNNVHEK